jgi:hypothetical protein
MGIFLVYRFFMTFGWGRITAVLMMVVKARPNRSPQGTMEPSSFQEQVEALADDFMSMSDFRFPLQTRGTRTATWSIRDKRRRVE